MGTRAETQLASLVIGIIWLLWVTEIILGEPVEVPSEMIDECFRRVEDARPGE